MLRSLLGRSQQNAAWQLLGNSQLHPWKPISSWDQHLSFLIAGSSHQMHATFCVQPCSSWTHRAGEYVCAARQLLQQWRSSDQQHWPHIHQATSSWHQQLRHSSGSVERSTLQRREEAVRSRQIQFEYKTPTLGVPMEPYQGPVKLVPWALLAPIPQPVKLWQHLWGLIKSKARTHMARAAAAKNIPGYSESALYDTIATMYERINQAQAEYRLEPIKDLVSRDMFLKLRAQMEQRKMGNWDKILWQIEPKDREHLHQYIKLVHGRMFKFSEHSPFEWIQLTFRIPTQQKFAAYRVRRGKADELVAGNPNEYIDVEDYWIFEHKTLVPAGQGQKAKQPVPGARWRLVSRLNLSEASTE